MIIQKLEVKSQNFGQKLGSIFALLFLIAFVAVPYLSKPVYATTLNWTTASLSQAREGLAATSVGNKALFAGGSYQPCCLGSPFSAVVDIYDAVTKQWTTASLSRARSELAATTVGNKAIFAGGLGWSGISVVNTNEVDIYNVDTGAWTTANLSVPRGELAATTVGNKAIFAGGSGSDRVDIYNSSTDTWSTASLSQPRWRLAATSVCGKAFFAGGLSSQPSGSSIVDIYEESTNTWSTASLSEGRSLLAATTAGNKAIFAGGLNSSGVRSAVVDIYDCDTNTWSISFLSEARHYLAATTLGGNALFGGGFSSSFSPNFSDRVDIYNGLGWNSSSLSVSRMQLAATTVGDKALFGGGSGFSNRVDIATLVSNLPPNANAGLDRVVNEGVTVTFNGSGSSDPNGTSDIVSYQWNFGDGNTGTGTTVNHTYPDNNIYTVTLTVTDTKGATSTDSATITVNNVVPMVNAGTGSTISEGGQFTGSGSFTDPGILDTHTATVNYGDGTGTLPLTLSGTSFSLTHLYKDNGIYIITVRVTDNDGGIGAVTVTVTVNNLAPSLSSITAPFSPQQVDTIITANANFTDPGMLDTHTATWNWGDGTTSSGTVTESGGSGSVIGSHTYTVPGIYTLTLTITDKDNGSGTTTFQYIVVYDPSGGFVTGGGWIDNGNGKVNFGFNSKYENGATVPTGQTQLIFKLADFNFHSTSYEWLVVSGSKAQFKGSGTVNGTGDYSFILTANDAPDKFRLKVRDKITGNVLYDTQPGDSDDADAATALGGGNVIIHN